MRRHQIDFLRVIAMFGVISIHVSSGYLSFDSIVSLGTINIAFWLNQISRFAVPLFVLISGLSLQISKKPISYSNFLKLRLNKIAIPYLFWCVIYFLYQHYGNLNWKEVHILDLIKSILTGNLAPHLYFIVIIIQLYLLFPLFQKIYQEHRSKLFLLSFFVTFLLQEVLFLQSFNLFLIPPVLRPYLWLLFPTWIFYFIFGMYIADKFDSVCVHCKKNSLTILVGTIFFALLFTIESFVTKSYDSSIKPMIILYVILIALFIIGAATRLEQNRILKPTVEFFSKHSMTIYFSHVLILNIFRHFQFFSEGFLRMFLLLIAVVLTSTIFSAIFDSFFAFTKKTP